MDSSRESRWGVGIRSKSEIPGVRQTKDDGFQRLDWIPATTESGRKYFLGVAREIFLFK